jgi:protein-disulfide isomerase
VTLGGRLRASDDAHVLGDPGAPVAVVEFGDFSCPYCKAAQPVLRRLVERGEGRVSLAFRHFPRPQVHPRSVAAALAAEVCAERGAFWAMHDLLFVHQGRHRDEDLSRYARSLGLPGRDVVGRRAARMAGRVETDHELGVAAGVLGTPALFVAGGQYGGPVALDALDVAVREAAP